MTITTSTIPLTTPSAPLPSSAPMQPSEPFKPVDTLSTHRWTLTPNILQTIIITLIIALGSLQLWIPLLTETLLRLQIQPEQIIANGKTYSPFSYFLLLDEKNPMVYPIDALWIYRPNLIRRLPIRGNIPKLREITLDNNPVEQLPETIGELTDLEGLYVINGRLSSLPVSIGNLTKLKDLTLSGNRIRSLPDSIGNLTNLTALNLAYNNLESLPSGIANLTNLEVLDLTGNRLRTFPRFLPPNLQTLFIGNNPIPINLLESVVFPFPKNLFY